MGDVAGVEIVEEPMKRTTDYREALLEDLRDAAEAAAYLEAAKEEGEEQYQRALRDVELARERRRR